MSTPEELQAELCTLTSMSLQEWADFFSLAPEQQAQVAENYRGMSWVQSGDTFTEVLTIIVTLGTIGGAIAGVASAASAVKALQAL